MTTDVQPDRLEPLQQLLRLAGRTRTFLAELEGYIDVTALGAGGDDVTRAHERLTAELDAIDPPTTRPAGLGAYRRYLQSADTVTGVLTPEQLLELDEFTEIEPRALLASLALVARRILEHETAHALEGRDGTWDPRHGADG